MAVQQLAQQGGIRLLVRPYIEGEIPKETYLVLAATDSRNVNQAVYRECKDKGILVNVCSDRKLCDFYFPGIVQGEDLVVGVTANGKDHRLARKLTEEIRKLTEGFSGGSCV